jgi:hypothetical protein
MAAMLKVKHWLLLEFLFPQLEIGTSCETRKMIGRCCKTDSDWSECDCTDFDWSACELHRF